MLDNGTWPFNKKFHFLLGAATAVEAFKEFGDTWADLMTKKTAGDDLERLD